MIKDRKVSFVFLSLFLLYSFTITGQNAKIDSLKSIVDKGAKDTLMVVTLNTLALELIREGDLAQAFSVAEQSSKLAADLSFNNGEAIALKYMGNIKFMTGNYVEVLPFWTRAQESYEKSGNKAGLAEIYNNFGVFYYQSGSHSNALDYYLQSLTVAEDLEDSVSIAKANLNIGGVYIVMRDYDMALEFFQKSEPYVKNLGRAELDVRYLMGIGEVYTEKGLYQDALDTYAQGVDNAPVLDRADILKNIGKVHLLKGDLEQAVRYLNQAFETAKGNNQQLVEVQSLIILGNAYKEYNYPKAIETFKEAESIAKEMEIVDELRDIYEGMYQTYGAMGDYANAYTYQELYIAQKDLVFNLETDDKIRGLQFDFDLQKKEDEIDLLEKEAQIQELQEKRQKTVTWAISILLFFIGLLALGQYRRYKFTKETNRIIEAEKDRSDSLLLNILPEETAQELKDHGKVKAKRFEEVTVLFTDFVGFTSYSQNLEPEELVNSVDHYFSKFDEIVDKYGLEKIKTIGDAYMCAGGLPEPDESHVFKIIEVAFEFIRFLEESKSGLEDNITTFDVRIGLNTGPVVAGVVGTKKFAYDIWGDTVNVASRMESNSKPGRINVSENTYQLIKDTYDCEFRGEIEVKNKGMMKMYFVNGVKDKKRLEKEIGIFAKV